MMIIVMMMFMNSDDDDDGDECDHICRDDNGANMVVDRWSY